MPGKLAAAIRAKHPGDYDNVDDATLEAAVKRKYPGSYDNFEDPPAQGQPIDPQETDNPLWAGVKGFVQGAKESWPVQTFTPDFVLEQRLPNKGDAQRILPGVAGAAAGIGTALTGVGLGAAVPAAMVAAGGTSKLLGNSTGQALGDAALEGVAGMVPVLGKAAATGGRAMVRGALGLTGETAAMDRIVNTAIREGVNASTGGQRKVEGVIRGLNGEVQRALRAIGDKTISMDRGLKNMDMLRKEMVLQRVPQTDIDALDALIVDLRGRSGPATVMEAQHVKSKGQERLAKHYASDTPGAVRKQGEEAYIKGVRQEIEDVASANNLGDKVGPVNQRVGELHELQDVLQQGKDPRVTGRDVMRGIAFGPQYAVADVGFRSGPQSMIGRRLAMEGDAVLKYTGAGGVLAKGERAAAQRQEGRNAVQSADFERRVGNAQQQRLDAADSALPVERPDGEFDLGKETVSLERAGIPVEQPIQERGWEEIAKPTTYVDRLAAGRKPQDLDQLGIPAQGGPVDPSLRSLPTERPSTIGRPTDEELWLERLTAKERPGTFEVPPRYLPAEGQDQAFRRQDTFRGETPGTAQLGEIETTFGVSKPRAAALDSRQGRYEDMSVELLEPDANLSGASDVSLEALSAAGEGWEYAAAGRGGAPRPLVGLRPEDFSLNPGETLVRRKKGTGSWFRY